MVEKAKISDAFQIAELHCKTIFDGFLPRLGADFLSSLYVFLIRKETVVVCRQEGRIIGFASVANKTRRLLWRFVLNSPKSMLKLLMLTVKRPALIVPVLETVHITFGTWLNAPRREFKKQDLPESELLSMAVIPEQQNNGVGSTILSSLETCLKETGITEYRVIVGEKLAEANGFYAKNGFGFATQISIHGQNRSNVYVKKVII